MLVAADDLVVGKWYSINWKDYEGQDYCEVGCYERMSIEYGEIWLWFRTDGLERCYSYRESTFTPRL